MEQYIIKGGNPLVGEVEIGGAKNAALGILAAAIMTDETIIIENLPDVQDINVLLEAISVIGAKVERLDRNKVAINGSMIGEISVDYEYIKRSGHPTICWVRSWASTRELRFPFRAAATSGADPLICI